MRVLILGGAGMLGHKLWQRFRDRFDTWIAVRGTPTTYAPFGIFDPSRMLGAVDATNLASVAEAIDRVRPDAIVNAIGVIKQLAAARDPVQSIRINALFPHLLSDLCRQRSIRLVCISTDCVFSGKSGPYTESDAPDPEDLYGRTKLLGEVADDGAWTVRTSMIGREIQTASGLVEWFLSQKGGRVRGYERALYTGFTTAALSDVIALGLEKHPGLQGVWHVSSDPISKHALLGLVKNAYGLDVILEPDSSVVCDRRLDSTRFRAATGYRPPTWEEMISEMRNDTTAYDEWRHK